MNEKKLRAKLKAMKNAACENARDELIDELGDLLGLPAEDYELFYEICSRAPEQIDLEGILPGGFVYFEIEARRSENFTAL